MDNESPQTLALGDTGQTLAFQLSRVWMRFHDDYAQALRPLNLTPSRMLGLAYLVHNADADQASLGRALGVNRASTMSMVDKLESAGYVVREPGIDRRTHALTVTLQGRSAYRKGMQLEQSVEQTLTAQLKSSDLAHLRTLLTRMGTAAQT